MWAGLSNAYAHCLGSDDLFFFLLFWNLPLNIPGSATEDGIEARTPEHFLIGKSLESIPDSAFS